LLIGEAEPFWQLGAVPVLPVLSPFSGTFGRHFANRWRLRSIVRVA
jgi:hypothetical protein